MDNWYSPPSSLNLPLCRHFLIIAAKITILCGFLTGNINANSTAERMLNCSVKLSVHQVGCCLDALGYHAHKLVQSLLFTHRLLRKIGGSSHRRQFFHSDCFVTALPSSAVLLRRFLPKSICTRQINNNGSRDIKGCFQGERAFIIYSFIYRAAARGYNNDLSSQLTFIIKYYYCLQHTLMGPKKVPSSSFI